MSLKIYDYCGSKIQFDEVDGKIMANATVMAAAFNKRASDWLKTDKAKTYIQAIATKFVLPENELIIVRNGGSDAGTWIHEKLILRYAQWLNVDFEIWCDEKITELIRTGRVEVEKLSPAELILKQAQQLVDHERRLDDIDSRVKKIEAHQVVVNHTIMGYANLKRTSVNMEEAKALGKKAAQLCRERGIEMKLIPDPRFGEVRTYPKEILEKVFNEFLKIDKNYPTLKVRRL